VTGEIVNLRRARKAKARTDHETAAQANRIVHGLTKTERAVTRLQRESDARKLDAHRRERPEDT
jgi:hypothetical protein